ncbi:MULTISPECIES: formate transporter FocA [Vibrio diabolicus subgroup]|uniref:formate transporter FocA n=1 Tax=Vibrio diabolicus subgroup TaxID=2315253 RepID=UPI0009412F52|nr:MULTISPECIES: formate transporter FocA [Vibrio diabolicus subgroup]MCQ9049681.1 formate transporter FocA [Vibrio diabolicus]MCR9578940.1 formate transporter FocA [Vibrio antiquarius]MCR9617778.1 formate transporter FocA [Vibrio antiquarius]MCR9986714.1 formate transporter FocA [Vibrio antiquarius]MDV5033644.1 formate transporter FocA [Vibrio diabolicus]
MAVTSSQNHQYFSPKEMMAEAEKFALSKANKTSSMTLSLAIMAGAFIGLAFLFYITVTTGSAGAGWGLSRLAGGLAFSMGLILIVICGGELFTSSVLSSISWANKQISFGKMLSIWGKVYVGNFIGAMFLLALVTAAGLYQMDNGQWGLNALNIAQHKLHHTLIQAFALGILCNLLVCLAIWLTFSSANAMTKAAMTIMPVAMFVSSGFEHCVANMFMVPLGIVIANFAPESFWASVGVPASQYADLNIGHFITANLIPVTLGNIVGGAVLVGLANWCIFRRPELKAANISSITTTTTLSSVKDFTMKNASFVKDIMNPKPVTISAETPIAIALDVLLDNNVTSAPVVDVQNRLVGFFSAHDVMVELWCEDYIPVKDQKVVDIMSRDVVAIDAGDRLVDVVEFLCIDKEQLYPTSNMGIATRMTSLSLEERAKSIKVSKPQVLPVLENGQMVGVVTRTEVLKALRPIFGERLNLVEKNELETA